VRSLLGQHASADAQRTVDEVIRAASSLSERKTGALVVFERETGLENIATTGVRIDGEVTAEMLATIFMPGTSLHDGAVIIRNARLIAAGCVLPLAETIPGVGRMGTRHRAAVGLTLQSDAVVLIVSEETGLISVAREGRITRGLDAKTLRSTLITVTGVDASERQGFMPRPAVLRAIRRRTHP
jgi:diadenylate cyclase